MYDLSLSLHDFVESLVGLSRCSESLVSFCKLDDILIGILSL